MRILRTSIATATGFAASLTLVACGGQESVPPTPSIVFPGPQETGSSATSERTLNVGTKRRSYALSLPDDQSEPMPVIIALHGRGGRGGSFLETSGLYDAPAIVAAPDGLAKAWAPAPYATETSLEDDAEFIRGIIDDLRREYDVDTSRIFITGFSNGGGTATLIAAQHPDLFAGVATVAAAVRTDPKELATGHPIDYLNIHGKADTKVPYAGEDRGGGDVIYSAEEVVKAFELRNGDGARTEHEAVEGMKHRWDEAASGGPNTNQMIFDFFGLASP